MAADAKTILKRQEQLESLRASVAGEAQAIRDFIMPLVTAPQAQESPGARTHTRIWDNSAELDLEIFVSGVYSLNTRPGLQWFRWSTGDDQLDQRRSRRPVWRTTRLVTARRRASAPPTSVTTFRARVTAV